MPGGVVADSAERTINAVRAVAQGHVYIAKVLAEGKKFGGEQLRAGKILCADAECGQIA